ncbi:CC-NBS-LRR resistance protein [Trifolium pratense]|uniref:CC-NBS-LRR resistance protein n=1 Tax=Trifolium pratense TaxID=57577 RepID=A0A2K3NXH0_TRIPR|nr:CC-NBS-LRR resistance protein [Trifolium pratense]
MAELVGGAFLSSFFQVALEKLSSNDFTDSFRRAKLDDTLMQKLQVTLNSINHVLEEAETKQYQNTYVKKWLGDLKHVYETDQLLDEIVTCTPHKKLKVASQPATSQVFDFFSSFTYQFESRIKELLEKLEFLAKQKDTLGLKQVICANDEGGVNGEDYLLQHQLQQRLTGKKYLLVPDDVWNGSGECWERLLLPFNHGSTGSKIVVTTRDKEVTSVMKSTKLLNLKQLKNSECWSELIKLWMAEGLLKCGRIDKGEEELDGDKISQHIYQTNGLHSLMARAGYGGQRFRKLADEISNLKLLRYLDLSRTGLTSLPDSICVRIKKMPEQIGRLNNLQTLTDFVVGDHKGSDIKELTELNHLCTLRISGLENVIDRVDAVTANLKNKKYLEELCMMFCYSKEIDIFILEVIQPNNNLNKLDIVGYCGNNFPNWIKDRHLPNLISLKLIECKFCSRMPPLGQLSYLRELSISGCRGIETIGEEFYGNNSSNVAFRFPFAERAFNKILPQVEKDTASTPSFFAKIDD